MPLPTISGTARLIDDVESRFSPSGTAVAKVRLAFNSRKKQDDGTWIDDKSFFVNGVMFKQAAENAAELTKGIEVVVTGRLATDQWDDKKTGEKRSAPSLLIDSIGPAVTNFQTATAAKVGRSDGVGNGSRTDDPWASAAPAAASRSGFGDDSPPF